MLGAKFSGNLKDIITMTGSKDFVSDAKLYNSDSFAYHPFQ
jgi:hypothetical protein